MRGGSVAYFNTHEKQIMSCQTDMPPEDTTLDKNYVVLDIRSRFELKLNERINCKQKHVEQHNSGV
jgi:hypothetical protein